MSVVLNEATDKRTGDFTSTTKITQMICTYVCSKKNYEKARGKTCSIGICSLGTRDVSRLVAFAACALLVMCIYSYS